MKVEQAKAQQAAARLAAKWCIEKLEMRQGGFGKDHEHSETERSALHLAHSIAACEIMRLQLVIDG